MATAEIESTPMRAFWIVSAVTTGLLLLGGATFLAVRVQHLLTDTRAQVSREGQIAFDFRSLAPMENPGFEPLAAPNGYQAGAVFQGKLYLAGPGGLAEFGSLDAKPKLWRTGLELPPAPIVGMAAGLLRGDSRPQLILATFGEGVLWYDGVAFRQLLPSNAAAREVTALLPLASGDLLIGTRQAGLLLFDGKALTVFHPNLAGLNVTALAGDEGDFWIGTRNRGVFHWHAGQLDSFDGASTGRTAGLPDPQVEAIALAPGKVYVGTPVGVEEFDEGRPARMLAPGFFAHALSANGDELTIASIDQGVREVALTPKNRPQSADGESIEAESFFTNDGLFAVGRSGVFRRMPSGEWARVLQSVPSPLTDRNIAALGFASDGRLWIGYFDRGLDILSADGQRGEHVEDDHVFCVNRIVADAARNTMDVATANGLAIFDVAGRERQVLMRRDGLIADQITDVSVTRDGTVVATPAGLTFIDAGGMESLYAFHGLVNNHVYSLARSLRGNGLLAGTLGGVSLLEAQSVRRNLTTANSGLKHNWTTAIVPVDDGWFVGTYGGGVMRLDAAGRFEAMEGASGPIEINPNAMLVTAKHVFAGSLGRGLLVYSRSDGDRGDERWLRVTAGLPSQNVTALAEHDGEIYVGTDNGAVRIPEIHILEDTMAERTPQ
jgi:ligand-binding sensor domain-containing protein